MPEDAIQSQLAAAIAAHRAGDLAAAERGYRSILATDARNIDALHLLGVLASQVGRHEAAIELLEQTVALAPDAPEPRVNLGHALRGAGRAAEALAAFDRAVHLRPDHAPAHFNRGVALQDLGRQDEAAAAYRAAIARAPGMAEAHNNLGLMEAAAGRAMSAEACFRAAIAARAEFPEAPFNLANLLRDQGRAGDAIALYRRAIELRPTYAAAHANLAHALWRAGALETARATACRAAQLDAAMPEPHLTLAAIALDLGEPDGAVAACGRAIELRPEYVEAWGDLGNAHKAAARLDDAVAAYRRAIAINPGFDVAWHNLLHTLHCHPGFDGKAMLREHESWRQQRAAALEAAPVRHANSPHPTRRLRVGYVAPYFRDHCQTFFTHPLLVHHDGAAFEVYIYTDAEPDGVTERLRPHARAWRDTRGVSDEALAGLIREDRIDILVDLALHMDGSRLLLFAREPAPVQITWLGYPGTTGLRAIDHRLSDPHLDPPGNDADYSEETVRLPETFWCYDPLATGLDETAVGDLPALAAGHITFGCLNNFSKVTGETLAMWARVLAAAGDARLILLAPRGGARAEVLARLGVDPARVTFVDRQPREKYLAVYRQIDLCLDTFPYTGHTTSLDALWMGVPVVSRFGRTAVSRGGLSQLTNLGMQEFVADSADAFVARAIARAGEVDQLAKLRRTLRARMQASPLMDGRRFAQAVEAVYRTLWQRWCG